MIRNQKGGDFNQANTSPKQASTTKTWVPSDTLECSRNIHKQVMEGVALCRTLKPFANTCPPLRL